MQAAENACPDDQLIIATTNALLRMRLFMGYYEGRFLLPNCLFLQVKDRSYMFLRGVAVPAGEVERGKIFPDDL